MNNMYISRGINLFYVFIIILIVFILLFKYDILLSNDSCIDTTIKEETINQTKEFIAESAKSNEFNNINNDYPKLSLDQMIQIEVHKEKINKFYKRYSIIKLEEISNQPESMKRYIKEYKELITANRIGAVIFVCVVSITFIVVIGAYIASK